MMVSDDETLYGADLVEEQARRLFVLCDSEGKGFVVAVDLQRLSGLLPPSHLEDLGAHLEGGSFLDEGAFVKAIRPLLEGEGGGRKETRVEGEGEEEGGARPRSLFPSVDGDTQVEEARLESSPSQAPQPHVRAQVAIEGLTRPGAEVSLGDELAVADLMQSPPYDEALTSVENRLATPFQEVSSIPLYNPETFIKVDSLAGPHSFSSRSSDQSSILLLESLQEDSHSQTSWMTFLLAELLVVKGRGALFRLSSSVALISPSYWLLKDLRTPDRIFKVVFVGDSAVGKTCFLHRFCHNRFQPVFNATIGVDFTVKTIRLKERLVAVQLWDTAGQERFRSITKQYFRKSDGVVLMYDVTSEQSFLHVRNWVDSVKAGVEEGTVMCLVGNKVDLFGSERSRTLTYQMGKNLADEFGMLYHETSAFTGKGVQECMLALAESVLFLLLDFFRRLQRREEDHLAEALKLEMTPSPSKRSWCCV